MMFQCGNVNIQLEVTEGVFAPTYAAKLFLEILQLDNSEKEKKLELLCPFLLS